MNEAGATVSPCGAFRYQLWRRWAAGPLLTIAMLNPSTADGLIDDPTIRRCVGFAKLLGYSGIMVLNLSAYRATDPRDLARAGYPIGDENDHYLTEAAQASRALGLPILCAWGAHARGWHRVDLVLRRFKECGAHLYALDFTADGIPRHPLMLPYSCTLKPYAPL